jgi:restriction system protein
MDIIIKYYNFIIAFIIVSSILIGFLLSKKRHRYRIKKSKEILKKIRSFKGDNIEKRIENYLIKIDPFTFEELLLTLFEESGCKIKRNKKYTGDGGIDGKFIFNRKLFYIQAKRYKNYIKRDDVLKFSNLCQEKKAYGVFIHTGKHSENVKNIENLSGKIRIIDKNELINYILNGNIKISN